MKHLLGVVFTSILAFTASSALALTITFDTEVDIGGDLSTGNPKTYSTGGYELVPVNLQNGHCPEDPCTIEQGQTSLPMLTRTDGAAFNLESFYFSPTGNGTGADNFVSVTGLVDDGLGGYTEKAGASIEFRLDDLLAGFLPQASVVYTPGGSDPTCTLDYLSYICKNYGYTVTILDGSFDFVTKVQWESFGTAQARLDTIVVNQIPLPAAGWLLLGGIGLLVARRRKAA